MNHKMKKSFLIATGIFAAVAFGQVVKINLLAQPRVSFILVDVISLLLSIGFLIVFLIKKNLGEYLKLIWSNQVWKYLILFLIWALISLIINAKNYSLAEDLTALSYWGRLLAVFVVTTSIFYFAQGDQAESKNVYYNSFILWSLALVALGFLQLIFVPDFSFMTIFGWDPHQNRMLSTFFDPNFFGLFLIFLMSLLVGKISRENFNLKNYNFYLFLLAWVALYFTYSRSSWLAGSIAVPIAIWPKSWKYSLFILAVFLGLVLIPNRLGDRFMHSGAFLSKRALTAELGDNLDDLADKSGAARTISIRRGLELLKHHWLVGVGYNAYAPALARSGILGSDQLTGYSNQGSDSSLVNILATTGIIGLSIFLTFLILVSKNLWHTWRKNDPKNYLAGSLFGFICGWLVASIFNNSLFYMLIFLPFLVLLGLALRENASLKETG
jgi:hypothetical protein